MHNDYDQESEAFKLLFEWYESALHDEEAIRIRLKENSSFFLICFLAQQMAEKHLKSVLAYHNKAIRQGGPLLDRLLGECQRIDPSFAKLKQPVLFLHQFYMDSASPSDISARSLNDAQQAFDAALRIKEFVLEKIEAKERQQVR